MPIFWFYFFSHLFVSFDVFFFTLNFLVFLFIYSVLSVLFSTFFLVFWEGGGLDEARARADEGDV